MKVPLNFQRDLYVLLEYPYRDKEGMGAGKGNLKG